MSIKNTPYITQDDPFGPINAGEINPNEVYSFKSLFEIDDWRNDKFYNRSTIIVGRRGSGKTHYLHNIVFHQQYNYYVEIQASSVLTYVAKIVQGVSKDIFFTETIAEIWEIILWTAVFSEVKKRELLSPAGLTLVETYLSNAGVKENSDVDNALLEVASHISILMNRKHKASIFEPIRNYKNNYFNDVKRLVINQLVLLEKNLVIIIDSPKDFRPDFLSLKSALEGLLMMVGSMNKPRDVIDIRFCVPAELYQKFMALSVNPLKDFRSVFTLEWEEKDILFIGAQRLMHYLNLQFPEIKEIIAPLDLKTHEDVINLFEIVFPKHINSGKVHEDALLYILRHTQLVPRHFLVLLKSIFRNFNGRQLTQPFPLDEAQIVAGVQNINAFLVREILSAFKLIYPHAEEVCNRCLPKLGYIFTLTDLKRVFSEHGEAILRGDSFDEFQAMLLEIGAIGRVISSKSEDTYIKGSFKYIDDRTRLDSGANLCLHPLFSSFFSGNRKFEWPVYPTNKRFEDNSTYLPILTPKETGSKAIFISYRRDDSVDVSGRIYDRLVQSYGKDAVFKDVDSIPPGHDFRSVLDDAVKNCDVFLVIIGSQWLDIKNADGSRRLDNPKDYVKMEIEIALKRNIPVIPILVQGAKIPPANKLPRAIKKLAYRNALDVRSDPDFHKDMDRLIRKL